MTSVTGKPRSRGFTLLETIIVLGIMAMFLGFFVVRFDDSRTEEILTEAADNIRLAALKAKRESYAFRKNRFIRFGPRGFELADSPGDGPAGVGMVFREDNAEYFPVPSGVVMEVWPPGAVKWQKLTQDYVWTFRESGLSEPLGVRFSVGNSYTILRFNVLTGLAEEETFIAD